VTPVLVLYSFQNEGHSHGGADTDGAWFEGGVGTGIARGGRGILSEAIAQEEGRVMEWGLPTLDPSSPARARAFSLAALTAMTLA